MARCLPLFATQKQSVEIEGTIVCVKNFFHDLTDSKIRMLWFPRRYFYGFSVISFVRVIRTTRTLLLSLSIQTPAQHGSKAILEYNQIVCKIVCAWVCTSDCTSLYGNSSCAKSINIPLTSRHADRFLLSSQTGKWEPDRISFGPAFWERTRLYRRTNLLNQSHIWHYRFHFLKRYSICCKPLDTVPIPTSLFLTIV